MATDGPKTKTEKNHSDSLIALFVTRIGKKTKFRMERRSDFLAVGLKNREMSSASEVTLGKRIAATAAASFGGASLACHRDVERDA
jgi:hypothetical protein